MKEQDMDKKSLGQQQSYPDVNLLYNTVNQLLHQISKRDQKIAQIVADNTAAMRSCIEKEQSLLITIAERDAVLFYTNAQLIDRMSQLDEIATSRTWKIALMLQQIRVFIAPLNSRRSRVLQFISNTINSFKKDEKR